MSRFRRPLVVSSLALAALGLAACDAKDQNAVNRAATGTKDAVNRTVDAVNKAQDDASKAADQINDKMKDATKPH